MGVRNFLVKLGNEKKDLRPHVREVVSELDKRASFNIDKFYRGEVNRGFDLIHEAGKEAMEKARKALSAHDIKLKSLYGRGDERSKINYRMHGSDGVLVGGVLRLVDQAQLPRGFEEIEEIVSQAVNGYMYQRSQPDDPREWTAKFGNAARVL